MLNALANFFTPEAGQARRQWLNDQEQRLGNALSYYLGPAAQPIQSAALLAGYMTPGADMMDAADASGRLMNATDPLDAAAETAALIGATGMVFLPGNYNALREGFTSAVDDMAAAYDPALVRSGFGQPQNAADEIQSTLSQRYPGVSVRISRDGDGIALNQIVVPPEMRGQGVGTAVMRDLISMAQERGLRIGLTPSGDFGGNVNRLRSFYRDLGFKPNSGRNRDFNTREAMILDWLNSQGL